MCITKPLYTYAAIIPFVESDADADGTPDCNETPAAMGCGAWGAGTMMMPLVQLGMVGLKLRR